MKKRKKIYQKTFWTVILTVLLTFVLLHGIADLLGLDKVRTVDITDNAYGEILRSDGTREENLKPSQWTLAKGDELIMHIPLPEYAPFEASSIVFHQYNSILTASINGKAVYSYGQKLASENKQIGNILVSIPVQDEDWGSELTVTAVSQEELYNSHTTEFALVESQSVSRYPLMGSGTEFIVFLMLMAFGITACMTEAARLLIYHTSQHIASLGLFCLLVGAWYFGYNRLFYVIVPDVRFNSMVEYYALDLALLPLLGVMHYFVHRRTSRRMINALTIITAIYCGGSLVLSLLHIRQLSDLLPGLQMLIGIILVALIVALLIDSRSEKQELGGTMLSGIAFAMLFAVIQIIAIRIQGVPGIPSIVARIVRMDYAAVGLVLLITSIIVSIAEKYFAEFRERTEKEELEKLAYVDILTGIPNRISCVRNLNLLKQEDAYAIGFFDVDGLKKANDTYGHETGDALIHGCADSIRNAFAGIDGFYGRWGGDEFIACFHQPQDAEAFEKKLREEIAKEDASGRCNVPISVSSGYQIHEAGNKLTANEIIDMADEKMYQNKIAGKKARQ